MEVQISGLNDDEVEIEHRLDFVESSIEQVFLSRKDTFKQHIVTAYQAKNEEVEQLQNKIAEMQANEDRYTALKNSMVNLENENSKLRRQIISIQRG